MDLYITDYLNYLILFTYCGTPYKRLGAYLIFQVLGWVLIWGRLFEVGAYIIASILQVIDGYDI